MVLAQALPERWMMETLKEKISEMEKEEILKALKECGWVMAKAARKLGITERMIGYKVNKYRIRTKEVRWAVNSGDMEGGLPGHDPMDDRHPGRRDLGR
jgi:ATP phosphoribosyltransferase